MPSSNHRRRRSWPEADALLATQPGSSTKGPTWTPQRRPSVLMVYFSYTHQTKKVLEAMAEVLRDQDCDVTLAAVEFTDPRYEKRFESFPLKKPYREMFGNDPGRVPGQARADAIPDAVTEREYDFVVVGAPTWWLSTDVAMRTFMESDTAARCSKGSRSLESYVVAATGSTTARPCGETGRRGGGFVDGIHFRLSRWTGALIASPS